jgi:hypothetical protein
MENKWNAKNGLNALPCKDGLKIWTLSPTPSEIHAEILKKSFGAKTL